MLHNGAALDAPTPDAPTLADRPGVTRTRAEPEAALIDGLAVSEQKKDFLRYRWLDQVRWMDAASARAGRWYSTLRLVAIVGGVLVPTLVSLTPPDNLVTSLRAAAIVIGLLVAICTAVEEFFHFGQKWRHYRQTTEALKSEGWQYFALAGPYKEFGDHEQAYPFFAGRVEERFGREVDMYISKIVHENERDRDAGAPGHRPAPPPDRS